ncbi:DUF2750 domain-containing protein [Psychromonas aquimarina]|uniref:DUF2750 domain-containing protein n=1 Tax=Psychromonas aquimarina TaxID=444919 RepID=UPI00048FE2F7|nr:DUF2750 domain-containing protein [Psychromonas aquimarina]
MGQSASQAATFYKDVAKNGKLWTCRDSGGNPAPLKSDGRRAMPFWSSLSRVQKIIKTAPEYSAFEPEELSWNDFIAVWAPDLSEHNLLIGVNWSGVSVTGYDFEPKDVIDNVEFHR